VARLYSNRHRSFDLGPLPAELQPKGGTTLKEVVPIDREAGLAAYAAAKRMP
jgi:hypothetical protein